MIVINCRICQKKAAKLFSGKLLSYSVSYYECTDCGYVQTEAPYWLNQAYAVAINDSDTGIMARNNVNARIVLATLWMLGALDDTLVDCAGGYGILVRLLRDYGINAKWIDPFCENLVARGFEYSGEQATLVTAFEAFEHFEYPSDELDHLLTIAPNILLSTEVIASPTPRQVDWWYYGKEHGQHIGFFKLNTLELMAKKRGKFLTSNGRSYHLMTDKPVHLNVWNFLIKANRLIPFFLSNQLKSKIWADHELMAKLDN